MRYLLGDKRCPMGIDKGKPFAEPKPRIPRKRKKPKEEEDEEDARERRNQSK